MMPEFDLNFNYATLAKPTPLMNHFICLKIDVYIFYLRLYLCISLAEVDNIKKSVCVGSLLLK